MKNYSFSCPMEKKKNKKTPHWCTTLLFMVVVLAVRVDYYSVTRKKIIISYFIINVSGQR